MGVNVAVQGAFQALRYSIKPLFTALLRLVIFVFSNCIPIYIIKRCYKYCVVDFSDCRVFNFYAIYQLDKKIK